MRCLFQALVLLSLTAVAIPACGQVVYINKMPCLPDDATAADVAEVRHQAGVGDVDAQFHLGAMFFAGCNGLSRDVTLAAQWWKKAAAQSQPRAALELGQLYLRGEGVPQNTEESIRLFRLAGEGGVIQAYYLLANIYGTEHYGKKDLTEEAKCYRALAERGVVDAMVMLGNFYDEGHGVPEDEDQAMAWWRRASEKGDVRARKKLAEAEAENGGEDAARAAKDLEDLARKGDGQAAFGLAEMNLKGQGVPKSQAEAKRWFEVAAEHDYGRIAVADRYAAGNGLPHDDARAFYWYEKAGCGGAGYQLGKLYEKGRGVPQDYAKAAKCYDEGKAHTNVARLALADLTAKGLGVVRDDQVAMTLYREAAEREIGGVAFETAMEYDLGRGVPHDEAEAASWWKLSGAYHNGGAALNLARKYVAGSGVPRDPVAAYTWTGLGADITYYAGASHKDQRERLSADQVRQGDAAIAHYLETKKRFGAFYEDSDPVVHMTVAQLPDAVAHDNVYAQFSLAYRLETGQGVPQDAAEAIRLYRRVVFEAKGKMLASLAHEYEIGQGRGKDGNVAMHWYRIAAEAGSAQAQYRLGLACEAGENVGKDLAEAYQWLFLASDKNTAAASEAEALKVKLSPEQLKQALEGAAALRASFVSE
jgi:uncharacterized protein